MLLFVKNSPPPAFTIDRLLILYFNGHVDFVNVLLCQADIAPCGFQIGMAKYLVEQYQ